MRNQDIRVEYHGAFNHNLGLSRSFLMPANFIGISETKNAWQVPYKNSISYINMSMS